MIKVGITGNDGFIGYHLTSFLRVQDNIELVPFELEYFDSASKLENFVSQSDVIVHLAGVNRHHNQNELYKINVELTEKLIAAANNTKNYPYIIFSSSTQEEKDNQYGNSKRKAREFLEKWAKENKTDFAGLIIPNVFGPFGQPFFNSFISTFSYQLNNDEIPKIETDAEINLIYVFDLVKIIHNLIINGTRKSKVIIPPIGSGKVSEILEKLKLYKSLYLSEGIIPDLKSYLEICLFNTFRSYIDYKFYPFMLKVNEDSRGHLVELLKTKIQGQTFYSSTKPGITRGNHFHFIKIERFCVVKGKAEIRLRKVGTADIIKYEVDGEKPSFVDIPVMHTHNITNTGNEELLTLFWTNEFYNPEKPDTYYEEV
jgi:UDP-2-acetamido-2,6-beta-L-arabino-hexul-4-ose reductase